MNEPETIVHLITDEDTSPPPPRKRARPEMTDIVTVARASEVARRAAASWIANETRSVCHGICRQKKRLKVCASDVSHEEQVFDALQEKAVRAVRVASILQRLEAVQRELLTELKQDNL